MRRALAEGPMIKSSESVDIARVPADVFRYVADLRNEPTWHVDIASVPEDAPPVPEVGRVGSVKFKPFMGKTDGTFTALEVEPGSLIVYRADFAGLQPLITYRVEPAGSGARFTRTVEMQPRGLATLMTPMMKMMVPKRNRIFVQNLKRVLES
jgi:uncharacterized protein YndB with AHSA1/START domain